MGKEHDTDGERGGVARLLLLSLVAALVVVLGVVGIVRARPFDPWRPGTSHPGRLMLGGCSRYEVVGEAPPKASADPMSSRPWVSINLTPRTPGLDDGQPPALDGTIEIADDETAIFTADDGRRWTLQRRFCPAHPDQL